MAVPLVALLGRPNVGKSTLFNRFLRENKALTHDLPGVTRDRIYGKVRWCDRPFDVVDTGGLLLDEAAGDMEKGILSQAVEAMEEAQLLVHVVDGREGLTPLDEQVAGVLRRSDKPVLLVVNKVDGPELEAQATADFFALGFPMIAVSAAHRFGVNTLMERVCSMLPAAEENAEESAPEEEGLHLALLGRPNVGKSSLINAFVGRERVLVSPVAGTTRDTVDVMVERRGKRYVFLDTAGVRRRPKVEEDLERYSVLRALRSSRRGQVTVLVIDAVGGVVVQDKKLLAYMIKEAVPFIVAVNKIDLIPERQRSALKKDIAEALSMASHAPVVYTSAVTRAGLGGLLPLAERLWTECGIRVTTGALNRFVRSVVARHQPPVVKRRRAKFYYMTQTSVAPPTFVFFVNSVELVKPAYKRFLENQIRKQFGMTMAPMRVFFRPSHGEREGT